jgi:beta-N-acetylhexosaminidase
VASVLKISPRSRVVLFVLLLAGVAGLLLLSSRGEDPGTTTESTNPAAVGPFVAAETATSPFPPLTRNLSAGMSAGQLAGQRVVAGFEGRSVPDVIRRQIREGLIGGVILFADNLGSRSQIRRLTSSLQRVQRPAGLRRYPLMVMVDQEGGLVKRLAGAPNTSAEQMGSRGSAFSRRQGRLTGRNLRNAGFNVDLAPVLDVARPGGVIADTDRGFGSTVRRVNSTAIPFSRALQATQVAATAKHFPGLGAATENTDFAVQRIRLSKRTLRRVDMAPYRPFIASGGKLVMVGSAIYPALGPRPAMFEPRIVRGELRQRLGFQGITITDAMGTVAVNDFGGTKRAAIAAAHAGMDILLYGDWQSASRGRVAIASRLRSGKLPRGQFTRATNRTLQLRAGLPGS